jgi:putative cell wall-binding protein
MKSTRPSVCRMCRGVNNPDNQFCWYCGASLRKQGYKAGGGQKVGRVMARGFKWLISAAVLVAVLAGTYYAVDRLLLPGLRRSSTEAATSTTVIVSSTTTTTTVPRTDHLVAGADRYATAISISKLGFPAGAPALVLAAGDDYAEAVCAAPLAVAYGGPVLLVPPEGISADLSAEIKRLGPSQIFLVAVPRPSTVTKQIQAVLKQATVTRLTGNDRYETAALVAKEVKAKLGTVSKVVIAPSDSFAEGIAVAPLAAAKGWPILLSPQNGDPPKTTTGAITELGATSALLVGTNAELALTDVDREVGSDGYETSALIAEYAVSQGLSFAHTAIATGENFPDGLAAGPYLALDKGILLLAKGEQLPPMTLSLLTANLGAIRTLDFIALPGLEKTMAVSNTGASQSTTTQSTTTQ